MPYHLKPAATVALGAWLRVNRMRLTARFACVLVPLLLFDELAEETQ